MHIFHNEAKATDFIILSFIDIVEKSQRQTGNKQVTKYDHNCCPSFPSNAIQQSALLKRESGFLIKKRLLLASLEIFEKMKFLYP